MKMQVLISLVTLAVSMMSAAAFAADQTTVLADCRPTASNQRDTGYYVVITGGGVTGMTLATVSEMTIRGTEAIGSVAVKENDQGIKRTYTGNQFKLSIQLESMIATAQHPATLSFKTDQRALRNIALTCTIN